MAETVLYTCDVCHAQRKESNHWWRAVVIRGLGTDRYLSVRSWNAERPNYDVTPDKEFHLCGSACVTKKVNEVLEAK